MAINQTKIDQAKLKQYNGRILTDPEKTIFDGLDEKVLAKVEGILESVLKVKDATTATFDSTLLTNLNKLRWQPKSSDERKAYEAINKDSDLAKNTITKLEAASNKPTAVTWVKAYFPNDKTVFDHSILKTASEVYQASQILNYVIWSRSENDSTLKTYIKGKLESAKTSNVNAYSAVNSVLSQADNAIARLSGTPNENEQTLQAELVKIDEEITKEKAELVKREATTLAIKDEQTLAINKKVVNEELFKKFQKALYILEKRIPPVDLGLSSDPAFVTGAGGRKTANDTDVDAALLHVEGGPVAATGSLVKLNEFYYNKNRRYFKNNITNSPPNRNQVVKKGYEAIAMQLIYYVFKDLDETVFFASIDKQLPSGAATAGAATKERAKAIFKKMLKFDFFPEELELMKKSKGYEGYGSLDLSISNRGEIGREGYKSLVLTNDPAIKTWKKSMKGLNELPEQFPYEEFFEFMNIVFPETTSTNSAAGGVTNPILIPGSNAYFTPPMERGVPKKWNIRWQAHSKIPPVLPVTNIDWAKWAKDNAPELLISEANYLEKTLEFPQLIEFYYQAFPSALRAPAVWNDPNFMSGRDADILTYQKTLDYIGAIETLLENNDCKEVIDNEEFLWDLHLYLHGKFIDEKDKVKDKWNDFYRSDWIDSLKFTGGPTTPLQQRIAKLRFEIGYDDVNINRYNADVSAAIAAEHETKAKIRDLEARKVSVNEQINTLRNTNVQQIKDQFWAIYRNPAAAPKYDENQIKEMITKSVRLTQLGATLEADLQTADAAIKKLSDEVSKLGAPILEWLRLNISSQADRLAKATEDQMREAKAAFEALGNKIKLNNEYENELRVINEKLENKKAPEKPNFENDDLKLALGIDSVDDNYKKKWTDLADSNHKYNDLQKIKDLIARVAGAKRDGFIAHIKANNGITKDGDDAWKEFFTNKPVDEIIKAIIEHELEETDTLKAKVKVAKDDKGTDQLGVDWTKYDGDKTEPTEKGGNRKGLVDYLYSKEIGKDVIYHSKEDKEDKGNDVVQKWYEKYYWASIWIPSLLIIGAVVVFWQNIVNWWNGPVEESEGLAEEGSK